MTLALALVYGLLTVSSRATPQLTIAVLNASTVAPAQGCLHDAGKEEPKQRDRNVAALAATRAVNTAQSMYAAKNNKSYAHRGELAGYLDGARYNLAESAEIVPGFNLTLDTSDKGYWFMIKDKTDPCGFAYISNQDGLIFAAQPIR